MSPFKDKVLHVIRSVPYGNVVSYGQVAAYVGAPRAARQVGWILRHVENSVDFPWWRVINSAGKISIKGNFNADKELQRKLLMAEGIAVLEDFSLDMHMYRFIPDKKLLKSFGLDDKYIAMLQTKFFTPAE